MRGFLDRVGCANAGVNLREDCRRDRNAAGESAGDPVGGRGGVGAIRQRDVVEWLSRHRRIRRDSRPKMLDAQRAARMRDGLPFGAAQQQHAG